MNTPDVTFYCSPGTRSALRPEGEHLVSEEGHRFPVEHGVPNLIWPPELSESETRTKESYDRVAEQIYDAALEWQFAAIREEEETVRESMLDQLDLAPDHRVLEIGCGTGRDSYRIARRLNGRGALFMQDLSPGMVHTCVQRMAGYQREFGFQCSQNFSISNATYLPFPDSSFDRVFHFGGFNEFADYRRAAAEFARVVKPGGLVLFGDEAVAPWLRDTDFGRIVIANNRLFAHTVPLDVLPVSARQVEVRWIMANCFYVVTFRKGDGPPPLDLDLPHQGWRGGTMRSRYYGVMEGIHPETKEMAHKAAAAAGLSIYEWLDQQVRTGAEATLRLAGGSGETGAPE